MDNVQSATVLSHGQSIETFKGVGVPTRSPKASALPIFPAGTPSVTRMATESAVTVAGSHPFSTGNDTCLVHNGSLSNHNRLREQQVRAVNDSQTENDSEVAAAYLALAHEAGRQAAAGTRVRLG